MHNQLVSTGIHYGSVRFRQQEFIMILLRWEKTFDTGIENNNAEIYDEHSMKVYVFPTKPGRHPCKQATSTAIQLL